jgi:hypothetical protein
MVFLDPYDTQQRPLGVIFVPPPPQDFAANKNVFRLISRPQLDQPAKISREFQTKTKISKNLQCGIVTMP